MKLQGKDLIFISQINRDGNGTTEVTEIDIEMNADERFKMHSLSITNKTYIACGFNSFVVKIKE